MTTTSDEDVCTCGRARGSLVHADGAINGHAFEAAYVEIDLRARQATVAELAAELGRALDDGRRTPDLLRLMKQLEDTARLPHAGFITRYKR